MQGKCKNYLVIYRENAGLSRQQASTALNISYESLRDFEHGRRPDETYIRDMVRVYGNPLVVLDYFMDTDLWKDYLPEIDTKEEITMTTLKLQSYGEYFDDHLKDLKHIACDGIITTDEYPILNKIGQGAKVYAGPILQLIFHAMKKPHGAGTHKGA